MEMKTVRLDLQLRGEIWNRDINLASIGVELVIEIVEIEKIWGRCYR